MKIPANRLRFTEGCVKIDGSFGEGGGQILRTACALSALTGISCRIVQIRGRRGRPGLSSQHWTAIRGLSQLCGAKTSALRVGERELSFTPGALKAADMDLSTATAGSVPLVFQSLLLAALGAPGPVEFILRGGTDVPHAPAVDYVKNVKLVLLKKMGIKVDFQVLKRGYYPEGGGIVRARVLPPEQELLTPLVLNDDDLEAVGSWGISHACSTMKRKQEAERQEKTAERLLTDSLHAPARVETEYYSVKSPGSGVVLWARTGESVIGASSLAREGQRAGSVADEAVERLVRTYHARASMDPWMGDQIIPYVALSSGPSLFSVPTLTRHMRTNMWVTQQFLNVKFYCENKDMKTLVHCVPQ